MNQSKFVKNHVSCDVDQLKNRLLIIKSTH